MEIFPIGSGALPQTAAADGRDVATHRVACAAQTQPPPTNPERLPSPRHTDALAESWCAALHQAVPCAQRQDVVVAHQRFSAAAADILLINSLRRVNGSVDSSKMER